jgi:hypothetical protein
MGFLDKAKAMADKARTQAGSLASQHHDKIDSAIDKGGHLVDQRTHGRYQSKLTQARSAAKKGADRLAAEHRTRTDGVDGRRDDDLR